MECKSDLYIPKGFMPSNPRLHAFKPQASCLQTSFPPKFVGCETLPRSMVPETNPRSPRNARVRNVCAHSVRSQACGRKSWCPWLLRGVKGETSEVRLWSQKVGFWFRSEKNTTGWDALITSQKSKRMTFLQYKIRETMIFLGIKTSILPDFSNFVKPWVWSGSEKPDFLPTLERDDNRVT